MSYRLKNWNVFLGKNAAPALPDKPWLTAARGGLWRFASMSTLTVVLCVCGGPVLATNHYIRGGATGTADGSDWNNAWSDLPTTFVRGDTYYVADGTNYRGITVSVAPSGTNRIVIKKAVNFDHGTNTGWNDSYGTNQAKLGRCFFTGVTGFVTIDGQTNAPYGFHIDLTNGSNVEAISCDNASLGRISDLTFRYMELAGPAVGSLAFPYGNNDSPRGIRCWTRLGYHYDNFIISHCSVQGFIDVIFLSQSTNTLIESSELAWACSGNPNVHENIFICWDCDNMTFRNNYVHHYRVEGLEVATHNSGCSNWKVYGNLVWADATDVGGTSRFVELYCDGGTYTNHQYYNNTFVDVAQMAFRLDFMIAGSPSIGSQVITNNVFYKCAYPFTLGSPPAPHDYNWFSGSSVYGEAHGIAGGTAQPFVNYAQHNFQTADTIAPTMPRDKGHALGAEFSIDILGNTRGADGAWDIGAYEVSAGVSTAPVIGVSPGNLGFGVVLVGSTNDLFLIVSNAGGATLSGNATVSSPFSVASGAAYSLGSNQSQGITIRYQPTIQGNQSANVTLSGGGGAVVAVSGAAGAVLPSLTFTADSGLVSSPFVISNGIVSQSVSTGVSDGGLAVYTFAITNAGDYLIAGIVNAPSNAENSLFVNVDAEPSDPQMIWHIPVTAGFQTSVVSWQGSGTWSAPEFVPMAFNLTAGVHQLIIRGREPNISFQSISIIRRVSPPTGLHIVLGQ